MSSDTDSAACGKKCPHCGLWKDWDHFSKDSSKTPPYNSYCKLCDAIKKKNIKIRHTIEALQSDDTEQHAPHLYIMCLSTDPCGVQHGLKIGCAASATARAQSLGTSMPFKLHVLAEFHGLGHLESRVHAILAGLRNVEGSGREWFRVSLADAVHAIATVISARDST